MVETMNGHEEVQLEQVEKKENQQLNQKPNIPKKNILISCGVVLLAIICLAAYLALRPAKETKTDNLFKIEKVKELTTLECHYRNVAVHIADGNILSAGEKYVWFEYEAIVEAGIDLDKVYIGEPTEEGVIQIYLPPAEIWSVQDNEDSVEMPVCELGLFTKLTTAEKRAIISEANENLKNDELTKEVVGEAYEAAKKVLEGYIINIGTMIDQKYTVEWLKEPPKDFVAPKQETSPTE